MSLIIVDKRKVTRDRTAENRQKFLRRIKTTIKEQLPKIIGQRSIKDLDSKGGNIRVNRKTIHEPWLHHDRVGGERDRVLPGNKEYVDGDLIDKDPMGSGRARGRKASDSGQSEDDFVVELSREEFLANFFEGLELPDMAKTMLSKIKEVVRENAGFQPDGSPNKLALVRSYKNAFVRKKAITAGIDEELELLQAKYTQHMEDAVREPKVQEHVDLADQTMLLINELLARKDGIPMFEDVDLRYRTTSTKNIPTSHATMIMIMDNSGSMGLKEKTIARKFFWLLYRFLKVTYEEVDIVPISHTTIAIEMTEDEFFNTNESGGTIVSSALDLAATIMKDRLIGKTNIYVAQVSDGDNVDTDNGTCTEILEDEILPHANYFAYVQVDDYHGGDENNATLSSLMSMYERGLWKSYKTVSEKNKKLQIRRVFAEKDIFGVFHELFSKKVK